MKKGKKVAIIAVGDYFAKAEAVCKLLKEKGIKATLINPRFISGVDKALIKSLEKDHKLVVTLEDGSIEGGFGGRVAQEVGKTSMRCLTLGLKKAFVDQFNPDELEKKYGLQPQQIARLIKKTLKSI